MCETSEAPETAAQDLRITRIVRETQHRTDSCELQSLSQHEFFIRRRRRDPCVVTRLDQALSQTDRREDVSPRAHRREHDPTHHTIKPGQVEATQNRWDQLLFA
jgi:hypothetical protein